MKKLLKVINKVLKVNLKDIKISDVVMDSRQAKKNSLFLALNSGRNYIEDVLKKEASLVITDDIKWQNNAKVIVVENVVATMQNLAKEYRNSLDIKVVGIVGSNGKTTTKDIVYSILSSKYKTKKTLGNYNNHIGVPFTLLNLKEEDEFISLEMGMSSQGEIKVLCEIASPDYGIITNIGDSHLEFLKTRENVFVEKSEIINYVKSENLIVFGDDKFLNKLDGIKVGFNKDNNYIIENYRETKSDVNFQIGNEEYSFTMNGKHNVINATFGLALGKIVGLSYKEIQDGLNKCKITAMRFEKIRKNGIHYINDSYNASPISMKYSLETFSNLITDKKKIAVLADMGELGEQEILFHKEVIEKALALDIEKIILFGNRMKEAVKYFDRDQNNKIIIKDTKDEIKDIIKNEFSDRIILLKGSNFNHLWEIMD